MYLLNWFSFVLIITISLTLFSPPVFAGPLYGFLFLVPRVPPSPTAVTQLSSCLGPDCPHHMWKKLFPFGVATRPFVWRSLSQDRLAGVEVGWPEGMSECTMLSPLPPSLKAKQENELPGSVILFPCRASQSKPWSCWQSCSPAPCCTAGELSLLHGSRAPTLVGDLGSLGGCFANHCCLAVSWSQRGVL